MCWVICIMYVSRHTCVIVLGADTHVIHMCIEWQFVADTHVCHELSRTFHWFQYTWHASIHMCWVIELSATNCIELSATNCHELFSTHDTHLYICVGLSASIHMFWVICEHLEYTRHAYIHIEYTRNKHEWDCNAHTHTHTHTYTHAHTHTHTHTHTQDLGIILMCTPRSSLSWVASPTLPPLSWYVCVCVSACLCLCDLSLAHARARVCVTRVGERDM